MGLLEGLVLLACGLFSGILATVYDVFAVGGPSFLSHFALWVVLNALIAVHVESRLRAILWAIPFNLGYIEGYFITTVATFEYYSKSTMAPLAAVALISPLLTYALWTARKENNIYGRILSVFISIGTVVASYLINGELGVYDVVMSVILLLILTVMPVRQLKVTRSKRKPEPQVAANDASAVANGANVVAEGMGAGPAQDRATMAPRRVPALESNRRDGEDAGASRRKRMQRARMRREEQTWTRENQTRRESQRQPSPGREERRRRVTEQRRERTNRRNDRDANIPSIPNPHGMSTLGTVRPARRSTRN